MAKNKQAGPTVGVAVGTTKKPKVGENPDDMFAKPLAWHFGRLDKKGPWKCTINTLFSLHGYLLEYEKLTCHEIFNSNTKRAKHCHEMPVDAICPEARKRLSTIQLQTDTLYQLIIHGKQRLWGIMDHNIFKVLWFDPRHEVYPMNITDN